jgi:hypothetical protein
LAAPSAAAITDPDLGGTAEAPCPLCGRPLYAWLALPADPGRASVGVPVAAPRVIERCENCGVALEQGLEIDLEAEWRAVCQAGASSLAVPNRASLQAAIGVEGWAGFDQSPGSLLLTPDSLGRLAEHNGHRLDAVRTPVTRRGLAWMWQTLVNGLTFHNNFAREVRAGRLRAGTARSRFAFTVDCVVTVLAAPLVALVSVPLELVAVVFRRGGRLTAAPLYDR